MIPVSFLVIYGYLITFHQTSGNRMVSGGAEANIKRNRPLRDTDQSDGNDDGVGNACDWLTDLNKSRVQSGPRPGPVSFGERVARPASREVSSGEVLEERFDAGAALSCRRPNHATAAGALAGPGRR